MNEMNGVGRGARRHPFGLNSTGETGARRPYILTRSHPDRPPSGIPALTRLILWPGETENPSVSAPVLTAHQAEPPETENGAAQ